MAVEFALFLSPDGIGLAHRQPDGHWALIGETSLEVADLGPRLARLRDLGESRGGPDFPTLLVLPDDQILYTDMAVDAEAADARAQVARGLDGRTPYALGELAFDFRTSSEGCVQVAAVAQQTLTEAIDFARASGFNGIGFAATPAEARFPGVPIFELASGFSMADTPADGIPFGPDTWSDGALDVPPPEAFGIETTEEPAQVFVTEAEPEEADEPEPSDTAPDEPVEAEPQTQTEPDPADASDSTDETEEEPVSEEEPETDAEATTEPQDDADLAPQSDDADAADADDTPDASDTAETEASDAEPELSETENTAEQSSDDRDEATEPAEPEPAAEEVEEPAPLPWADAVATEETPEDPAEPVQPADDPADTAALDDGLPGDQTDVPDETHAPSEADADPAMAEAEAKPEPDPAEIAAFSPATEMSDDSAAFVTEPDDAPTDPADAEPAVSTHRPLLAEPPAPGAAGLKRRLQLDMPGDGSGSDSDSDADDPADDEGAASTPKPRGTRPRRRAKTPALFAGSGNLQDVTRSEARVEPILEDMLAPLDPVEPAEAPPPTADADADAPAAPAEVASSLPAGLLDRLGERRGRRGGFGEVQTAPMAARVAAAEGPLDAEINDQLMAGGLLGQRVDTAARPSLRTALVLTIVLVLILALIAVWSALFLPESRVAQLFGRFAPEVEVALPPDETPELAPEPELTTALVVPDDAIPAPDPTPEPRPEPEAEAPLPVPPPARVPPPSLEEAQAEYAQYGIWQLPPNPPAEPATDFVIPEASDNIELAALSPVTVGHDAIALLAPSRPVNPSAQPSPPPFGASLTRQGLVAATPEGVVTPEGVFVILAQPEIAARPRPGPVPDAVAGDSGTDAEAPAQTAAGGLGDAILAAFPPTPRPEDLVEPDATDALTTDDLATRQPQPRPQSPQEEAESAREGEIDDAEGSELAVASSIVPQTRPASIAAAAEEARGPAAAASTASLTAPTSEPVPPPTVVPDIPSSASVSRTATVENVIDLREINLIGVRGTPDDRVALVRLASGRFVTVSVGDRLDGGRVAAISADSLQYVRNGRNITLQAPDG